MAKNDKKVAILIWSVIILFFTWSFLFPGQIGSSNGIHTGLVTAVEYNSNIIWGSHIVYFQTIRASSYENKYCVTDENVKNKLIKAQKEKKEITIYYNNNFVMWKWQCNGGESIIYKVE